MNISIEPEKFDQFMTFDKSLERLRREGYERHLRPVEAFGIIIDYLEKNEESRYLGLAKDLLSPNGEWLSVAFKKEKNLLHVATDPENFVWDNVDDLYVVNGSSLICDSVKTFDIGNKRSESWVDLGNFSDEFVMFLCGRRFKDLPEELREGDKKIQICLGENVWWPVGRGIDCNRFDLDAYCNEWTSRGVRKQ